MRIRRPACRLPLAPSLALTGACRWAPAESRSRADLRFLVRRFRQALEDRPLLDCQERLGRGVHLADCRWEPAPQ